MMMLEKTKRDTNNYKHPRRSYRVRFTYLRMLKKADDSNDKTCTGELEALHTQLEY